MHGVSISKKLVVCVKVRVPEGLALLTIPVEAVRRSYMRSSLKSTNRASRELHIPQLTVWKIVYK
jgi:hypothetical protein